MSLGTTSNLTAGAEFGGCARAATNTPASVTVRMFKVVFMVFSWLLLSAITRRWLENQFLHAPRFDLADDDLIRVAAINHVDHLKAGRGLAGVSEPAKHFAVELGLVDFAGDVPRSRHVDVRMRIRKKDVPVRAAGNTS